MLSNIFLFTGEEKYLLHQELKRRTDGFVQKYGTDALLIYKTDDLSLESLRQVLYSGGLFAQKRMIVVYGLPLDGDTSNKLSASIIQQFSDEFMQRNGVIVAETILIFVSYKPDKRTKFYTFLKKELDPKTGIKEFGPLKPIELKQIIRQKSPTIKRSESVLDSFLAKTGPSLLHIQNELNKLLLWSEVSSSSEISEKDIDLLTFGMTEGNNLALFDMLFSNKQKALELVARLQEEGESWNAFVGTLYRGIKNWLFVLDCFEQNIKDSKIITSILKAHPFVVSKITKNIDMISRNKKGIISFYRGLIELDNDIKTGKKSDLNFWLDVKKMIHYLF
ncbi:hypothetical protein P148_SR1C00001G0848 [candidate division SR1 bacterium RAAC1_SR1_1]|nr:hypothetical protein P148_SR1C00001G0848 [candidate division SR1 bacterium RAAC1_SR1_1]